MTTSRSQIIDSHATPYYHCMTRCVRRSYLCGQDSETGKDYSHRKERLIARMKWLASVFSIKICAYAVMSNHYHLVLFVDTAQSQKWSDDEVRSRWGILFPRDAQDVRESRIPIWRERLSNISWFMRCLNEHIARTSNKEDECKGRFWEGRFKSQALLDEGAILTAMAYVDLNPVRANVAETPETSEFTSVFERIQQIKRELEANQKQTINETKQPESLMPFAETSSDEIPAIPFQLSDYMELIDATGRIWREDKKGMIDADLPPILSRLQLTPSGWMKMVQGMEKQFFHAVGGKESLLNFGLHRNLLRSKGIHFASLCYLPMAA